MKKESEKACLKLSIQDAKIMASNLITSWQINGKTKEKATDYFLGLQNHCRWWLPRLLSLRRSSKRRKPMQNLDSILKIRDIKIKKKSRDITFADKGPYRQSYVFFSSHVWMWVLNHREGWMLKNLCFELWCWRRLLRNPWTARRSNQSILKEINSEYWLDGLMLKLKLQYFGTWYEEPVHSKKPWYWKRLKAEREGDNRRWLDGINDFNGH